QPLHPPLFPSTPLFRSRTAPASPGPDRVHRGNAPLSPSTPALPCADGVVAAGESSLTSWRSGGERASGGRRSALAAAPLGFERGGALREAAGGHEERGVALDPVFGADGQALHAPATVDRLPCAGLGPALLLSQCFHDIRQLGGGGDVRHHHPSG